MSDWKNFSLGDVCNFSKDKVAVSMLNLGNYISTENLLPNKGGITEAASLPKVVTTTSFDVGDILISNIRPYFKKIWRATFRGGCSNDVLAIRAKENIEPKFLYYVLSEDKFFDLVTATAKGTKMPRGDKQVMMNYPVPDFSLETQKKIAAVLSALDDKIELNNAINKNLEEQAQAIFKNMFVDNFNPAWKSGTLSDIAEITMGQSPSGKSYNDTGKGMIFFQGRTDFGFRFPSIRMFTTEPKRLAKKNDILFSVRAPVGDYNVAVDNCCIGRGLAALSAKNNQLSFLFYTMFYLKKQIEIYNGQGTVFGAINQQELKKIEVIIPEQSLINEFEKIVAPMDSIILNNHLENQKLGELRDALLPKLMSGEIDVSAVEI